MNFRAEHRINARANRGATRAARPPPCPHRRSDPPPDPRDAGSKPTEAHRRRPRVLRLHRKKQSEHHRRGIEGRSDLREAHGSAAFDGLFDTREQQRQKRLPRCVEAVPRQSGRGQDRALCRRVDDVLQPPSHERCREVEGAPDVTLVPAGPAPRARANRGRQPARSPAGHRVPPRSRAPTTTMAGALRARGTPSGTARLDAPRRPSRRRCRTAPACVATSAAPRAPLPRSSNVRRS